MTEFYFFIDLALAYPSDSYRISLFFKYAIYLFCSRNNFLSAAWFYLSGNFFTLPGWDVALRFISFDLPFFLWIPAETFCGNWLSKSLLSCWSCASLSDQNALWGLWLHLYICASCPIVNSELQGNEHWFQ